MMREQASIAPNKGSRRRRRNPDSPRRIEVYRMKNGRPVAVQPGGIVDVAVREFDAQIVEVILVEPDELEPPFSEN